MNEIFQKVASEFGTPVYIYFEKILEERINKVKNVFEEINFFPTFAAKANNNPAILKILKNHGFGVDILGEGELLACKIASIEGDKIVWNGNGKTKEQKDLMKEYKVKYVNVDSKEEFENLWKNGDDFELFLRVNPDIDAKTHPYISTGLKKHKFGVDFKTAEEILKSQKISGVHIHIGSQITDVKPFKEAIEKTLKLCQKYNIEKINIGGGWGIKYKDENEINTQEYKEEIIPLLKNFKLVINELGRFIIAPAGFLLTKVILVKKTDEKFFVVTESGMNHLLRPALYNAYHKIEILNNSKGEILVDVVGPLCESGDFLAKERKIKKPEIGDLLVIKNAGAYGFSMANNYNGTIRPAEVLITKDGKTKLIRKRETFDDLFKNVIL
ncbi:diaminopimelate decarboxylase [Thermosipho japonicus]|uniref:Diaminopimelate decarboxylase n=1 Tax=Thermosipho japonicus TaxID=90323 RepID=A0A841GR40_9BACT|nr:diaminopimelate decarboxylase [Thermosipho japonicus]MBB6062129.1 diaminopimelate decarboxylase [Thermosipho japonicus]